LIYQPEWISNAFFQSFYTHPAASENVRLAFEWLLLQSVPDGTALQYNHPASVSLANVAYLGAQLQKDARYIWLSGRALANIESRGEYLFAQPGVESAVDLQGYSPTQGSCLIYGDSGLPNQVGPLAPDKIVFRDGWSKDSTYVLLNLRFTGWHRYKATNTLMLLYQGGPLVTEEQEGPPFSWLPTGRSLFRDKRIPRENLNGLLVESTGMSAVVYGLTGIGSPWAQDPPYYAEVEHFETGAQVDSSTVLLKDWRGWQDRRTVYFYHGGPTVVVDEVVGSPGRRAALTWHVAGNAQPLSHRIKLRDGAEPAEMLFLSTGNEKMRIESLAGQGDQLGLQVIPGDPASGQFNVVTVFLMGDWVGANVDVVSQPNGTLLQIVKDDHQITIPLMPRKDGVAR
jgi:hypothetical protein